MSNRTEKKRNIHCKPWREILGLYFIGTLRDAPFFFWRHNWPSIPHNVHHCSHFCKKHPKRQLPILFPPPKNKKKDPISSKKHPKTHPNEVITNLILHFFFSSKRKAQASGQKVKWAPEFSWASFLGSFFSFYPKTDKNVPKPSAFFGGIIHWYPPKIFWGGWK